MILALAGVGLFTGVAQATNYTWTGTRSTELFDARNWSPAGVPTSVDSINVGGNKSITTAQSITVAGLNIGPGSKVDSSGSITVNGPLSLNGATCSSSGNVVVNGTLTMSGAKWSGAGSLTANGPATASNSTLSGDTSLTLNSTMTATNCIINFSGRGNLTINSTLTATDCTFQGGGTQVISPTGVLKLLSNGGTGNHIKCIFSNSGLVVWISGNLSIDLSLKNEAAATIEVQSSGTLSGKATASLFENAGTIRRSANAGVATVDVPYTNTGLLDVEAGTLEFSQPVSQTTGECNLGGGNIIAHSGLHIKGGKMGGTGTITGDVVNDGGRFTPGHSPGAIIINGNYTQTANGTLDLEIGGTSPGTSYDQMIVSGTATLNGTLNIVQYNGFMPREGDNFELIDYYSVAGNFTTVNYQYPGGGVSFTPSVTPIYYIATAHLTATPTPTPTPVADTTAPTVTVTSPVNNAAFKSLATATGTAADGGSGLAAVTVQLYRYVNGSTAAGYWGGGTTWNATYNPATNERPATGTSSWSLALPTLAKGQYRVRATAKDKAGNSTSTTDYNFWIDTTVPATVTFTTPANAATVSSLSSLIGAAADNSGGSGIARVDVTIKRASDSKFWSDTGWLPAQANIPAQTTKTSTNTAWSHNDSATTPMPTGANLTNGSYTLTATAYDNAGNSKAASITVTVDTTAPTVAVTAPVNGSTYTTLSSATGTAGDVGSSLASVTVMLYRYATATTSAGYWGGGTTWNATYNASTNERAATGTTSWSLTLPTLAYGMYYLRATAKDKAGNLTSRDSYFLKSSGTSTVNSSTASASLSSQCVQIVFTGALDATVASDPSRYTITRTAAGTTTGTNLTVQSVTYSAATNTVSVYWPAGSVLTGDKVVVAWSNLYDTGGKLLSGQTASLTAG